MKNIIFFLMMFGVGLTMAEEKKDVPTFLQEISVTIKGATGEGSGFLVTRKIENTDVTFVWTAGHCVEGSRVEKEVVDSKTGQKKIEVTFNDVKVVKELREDGRRVGEIVMDAEVVKYSEASGSGHDLALLMVRKKGFSLVSAEFYLDDKLLPLGTQLFHVGSLLGQDGHNSMTTGILSQTGRVFTEVGKHVFDQTTVTAFPGSSGGGIYTTDGKCVGMLVRGSGESFNFIVPIRRMKDWVKQHNLLWAIDVKAPVPSLKEIEDIVVDDVEYGGTRNDKHEEKVLKEKGIDFLLKYPSIFLNTQKPLIFID